MNERTVDAKITGFTPALDVLIERFDPITALVWGRIWRYSQMKEGVCRASQETIATELNISIRTVGRKIKQLVGAGYLTDCTPGLRHSPHTYVTTNLATVQVAVEAVVGKDQVGTSQSPTSEQLGTSQSPTRYVTESDQDSIKKVFKRPSKNKKEKQDEQPIITPTASPPLDIGETMIEGIPADEWFLQHKTKTRPTAKRSKQQILDSVRDCVERVPLDEQIKAKLHELFHVNFSWVTQDGHHLLAYLRDQENVLEKIDTWAEWYRVNHWKGKKQQPPSLRDIYEYWPTAFEPVGGDSPAEQSGFSVRRNPDGSFN